MMAVFATGEARMTISPDDRGLDRNPANLQPSTPLTFDDRAIGSPP
jgi:hypothetical protein